MIKSVCFLFVLISSVNAWKSAVECKKTSTCSCQKDNGEIINLSALSTDNGKPKFQNVIDIDERNKYSLSVCSNFSQGNCSDVAICQIHRKLMKNHFLDVGDLNTAAFMEDENGQITINYKAGNRRSFVNLTCNHSIEAQLIAMGEQPARSSMYHFQLISKYACPVTSPNPRSSSTYGIYIGIGVGVVVCVLVLVASFLCKKGICSKYRKGGNYDAVG